MELLDALLFSLLMGAATPLLSATIRLLVALLFHVIDVKEQAHVSSLDRLLAESGWCSSRSLEPGRLPAEGFHFLFLRGPVLAARTRTANPRGGITLEYTLYIFGKGCANNLSKRLTGDPRDVILRYVYAPAAWRTTSFTMRAAPPPRSHAWQTEATETLFKMFQAKSSATMLVCGPMGTGKSTLGELVAVALKALMHLEAVVVKNFDLTLKGLILEDVYDTPDIGSPVILVLDEFDSTIDHAEKADKNDGKSEGTSLAETPTSLLSLLDRLHRTPHLIVIATSNRTVTEMTAGIYARYTRAGRIDTYLAAY